MGPLGLVELQGVGDAVDDALGDAGGVAALEPDVVLRRDAGEQGDLLAAQARDASAVAAVGGQPRLLGGDPGPAGGQELPDLCPHGVARISGSVAGCHVPTVRALPRRVGVTVSDPSRQGLPRPRAALVLWMRATADEAAPDADQHRRKCIHMTDKKVWLVTGAGRGLGVDIAKAALAAGHAVVATARNTDSVTAALGEHDDLLAVTLDVTDPAAAEAAVQAAVERFGRLDVLVNNAGSFYAGFFEEMTPEDFRAQIETTLFGPVNVTRAALPQLRAQRSGLVVTISSTAGIAVDG